MTTEEKLQHFSNKIFENATNSSTRALNEFKINLDKLFEQHKAEAIANAEYQQKANIENIKRKTSKDLTSASLNIKRKITLKQNEIKDKLFNRVAELIAEYRNTPEYTDLLAKQIIGSLKVAKNEPITIYIDPDDKKLLDTLQAKANTTLTLSEYSFMGGSRAVISSKNILIDNSFATKFNECKEAYTITI